MSRRFATCFLAMFLFIGCGPLVVPTDHDKPSPVVPKVDTVWTVLADYVDAGNIENTDTLILIVDRLVDRGSMTDLDRAKFYEAFPGIREKRRDCVPPDALTLRGMK